MSKRPALYMAIAFCTGIASACFIKQVLFIMLIFLIIMLICGYAAIKKIPGRISFFITILLFFCGYINYAFQYTYLLAPLEEFYDVPVAMSGYVSSPCEESNGKLTFDFYVKDLKFQNSSNIIKRTIKVSLYSVNLNEKITLGRFLVINGELRKAYGSRNPGGFNYQNYLLSSKTSASISAGSNSVIVKDEVKKLPLPNFGHKMQQRILNALDKNLTYEKSALMAAMLTGYRENLTDTMEDAFSASGLIHIMAVSGANLVFLLIPVLWLFRMLGFNRKVGTAASIPLIFIYILITGMEASVMRASVMALIILTGTIFDRKAEVINSLCVASLVILAVNPFMLMDVGFQLSAAATAGLGLLYKKIHGNISKKIPGPIRETTAATAAAQAGVLPILMLYFSKISVVSLFSNLLVVPLTGITTVIGMVLVIIDNISHQMGEWSSHALQALLHIILLITNAFASVPWAELNMKHWNALWIFLYYVMLIIFGCSASGFFARHKNKVVAFALVLGIALLAQGFIPEKLKVSFIDVGQGDSALIKTPGGITMLIDGGGTYNELDTCYIGQNTIFPVLMHERIDRLDYVMLTHADADHMYGIMTLMDIFPVKRAVLADYSGAEKDFSRLIDLCRVKGTEIVFLSEGDTINLDNETDFEILYPSSSIAGYSNLNNTSLCGMLKYKQFQILFTGDIEKEAEGTLLRTYPEINCDILKVSHHGGKNGSSEHFLKASQPEAAIISVGRNNYGHPSEDVKNRLSTAGAKVYTTLECGAVIVESDGISYRIKTWLRNERFTFLD